MNPIKTLFVIAALTVSSLAMAEGGGDRTFARMEVARNNSIHFETAFTRLNGAFKGLLKALRGD